MKLIEKLKALFNLTPKQIEYAENELKSLFLKQKKGEINGKAKESI